MRIVLVFIFILTGWINGFADSKKKIAGYGELDEKTKLEFDYSFLEGVRNKITGDYQSALGWFDNCLKIYPGSPVVKYEIANLLLLNKDYNGALLLAREAVSGNPGNFWYQLLLADVLQNKSMIEEACAVYDGLIATHPRTEEFYIQEAGMYVSVEKWQKAIDVYDRYEKEFGLNEIVSIEKIKLYTKLDDIKGASNELSKLIREYPEKDEYLSLLAELYFNYNQDKKGLQILNRLLSKDPENGMIHFYLADYYRDKGNQKESEQHVVKALSSNELDSRFKVQYMLKLVLSSDSLKVSEKQWDSYVLLLREKYPEDLAIRSLYSDFLKKEGKLDESRSELEYILSKDKDNYIIWQELLILCNEMEDTACIYERSTEALKYFPEEPLPYAMAGISRVIRRQFSEALPFFKKGVELTSGNREFQTQFYAYLGDCYYSLDSVEQAFNMFEQVLSYRPDDLVVLNNYAYYLSLRDEDLAKAERMSAKTVLAEPENDTYLDTYAWVLFRRKEYSQALYYIKLAVKYSREPSGVLYEHYGDILYYSDDREQAVEMWKKALETGGEDPEVLKSKISGEYDF
ncbi:MAG: hypothetical protein LBR65_06835 [Culturomica sp.]|jgi:tetratricopeptide (TPR) repeat protein|nr:hypothetical protein [Culturomica sp.]